MELRGARLIADVGPTKPVLASDTQGKIYLMSRLVELPSSRLERKASCLLSAARPFGRAVVVLAACRR